MVFMIALTLYCYVFLLYRVKKFWKRTSDDENLVYQEILIMAETDVFLNIYLFIYWQYTYSNVCKHA